MLRKILYISFLCIAVGCSQQRGPVVQFVEGTVTFDGVVVADATVSFAPKSADGIPAVGKTDANGVYRLTSAQGGEFEKGAVIGEYDVVVRKYLDLDAVAPVNPQPGDYMPMAKPKHHLPERYADAKTSGLSATVKKGKNQIDFHLEK